jgi:exodeoxyribonuclease VII large subunit
MKFEAPSVSELIGTIKSLLEEEFQEVMVQGEVTNLSLSASGHWYFNLSDESSMLSCALFRGDALKNPLIRNIKDGDKVVVLGPVSVYQKRGTFQLLTKRILPAGEGQLKLQLERLKSKLANEGLFDLERKKNIPKFPKKIAVITAEHGAALQDFLNVIKRRSLWFDILIVPALVQGEGASKTLIKGIQKVCARGDVDVIVITRGGGSLEDLWAFNDEELVRTIFSSPIPVISAVGHEVDYSLADYVADLRAETPTAAAEILSQPQTELIARISFCASHLKSQMDKLVQRIQILRFRSHPKEMLNLIKNKLQFAQKRLSDIRLKERTEDLIGIHESEQRLDELELRLRHSSTQTIISYSERLRRLDQVLNALNPELVLKRGYSIVKDESGQVIPSAEKFKKYQGNIMLQFQDGILRVSRELP